MKLRLKYLGFLALFLTGSFLIVTWKSYDIFSRKYAQSYQSMQIQDLEKQAMVVNHQFENLKNILKAQDDIEPLLKVQGIALMARILKENGNWKAQWFEGQTGLKAQAQGVASQIPFDSLSTSKKSWHFVTIKDYGVHLAFILPVHSDKKVSYYSFFFKQDFFSKWFQAASMAESFAVMSPQAGEIYNFGEKSIEGLDQYKEIILQKQTGLWALSKNRALLTYFHPDLQLMFVKNITLKNLVIESSAYLWALFAAIGLLVVMALVAFDLLFRGLFQRLAALTQHVRGQQKTTAVSQELFIDELSELEERLHQGLPVEAMAQSARDPEERSEMPVLGSTSEKSSTDAESVLQNLRPLAINCLGYLNRLKSQLKDESSQFQMLEKELRELRRLMEVTPSKPAQELPFNPLVASNVNDEETLQAPGTIQSELDVQTLLKSIRKPKRESHEVPKL